MTLTQRSVPRPTATASLAGPAAAPWRPWVAVGAVAVAVQAYVYVAWVVSGEARRVPTGRDPVPTATKLWAISHQVLVVAGFVVAVVWLARRCRRDGRLTADTIFFLGWVSVLWLDPMVNFVRTVFFYNSYLVNLGSWAERIPGWISPNGRLLPEPLLFTGLVYAWFLPVLSMVGCAVMRWARDRWPQAGTARVIAVGYLALLALELAFEVVWIRFELFAYPGTIHEISISGGRRWQFPLYESAFWGGMLTAMAALRFLRDDRGATFVERGLDRARATARVRGVMRVLAVAGFANVAVLTVYVVPVNVLNLYVDEQPAGYPSYLVNGMCGPGTGFRCPSPDQPIPLPDTPPFRIAPEASSG